MSYTAFRVEASGIQGSGKDTPASDAETRDVLLYVVLVSFTLPVRDPQVDGLGRGGNLKTGGPVGIMGVSCRHAVGAVKPCFSTGAFRSTGSRARRTTFRDED